MSEAAAEVIEQPVSQEAQPNVEPVSEQPSSDNWRDAFIPEYDSQEDTEKAKNILGRYTDQKSLGKALVEMRKTISKNETLKRPENATDEQLAEYKKQAGLPDSTEGYAFDAEVSDADKPLLDNFYKSMFDADIPKEVSDKIIGSHLEALKTLDQQMLDSRQASDNEAKESGIAALREQWGVDYVANTNIASNMINALLPEGDAQNFKNARLEDGTPLLSSPVFLSFMAEFGRKANPSASVVPSSNNPIESMQDEIANLEKQMGDPASDYNRKDSIGQKTQARYRELVTALQQSQS